MRYYPTTIIQAKICWEITLHGLPDCINWTEQTLPKYPKYSNSMQLRMCTVYVRCQNIMRFEVSVFQVKKSVRNDIRNKNDFVIVACAVSYYWNESSPAQ